MWIQPSFSFNLHPCFQGNLFSLLFAFEQSYFHYIIEVIQENLLYLSFIVISVRGFRFCTKLLPHMYKIIFQVNYLYYSFLLKLQINKEIRRKGHLPHHKIAAITRITCGSCLTIMQSENYREKFDRWNAITQAGPYPGI